MACLTGRNARADALYTITNLGTLSGQSSSVATSINDQGQVVGISYNASDGTFADSVSGTAQPPRFTQTGNGAESFLYSNGQMTQISPTGGLAMSINSLGQVVGGEYASVNSLGQYVGGQEAGIQTANPSTGTVLVSGGTTTDLSSLLIPYAINASGQIAGYVIVDAHGGSDFHPAVYENGQDSRAVAINANGDMLITVQPMGGSEQSYIYHASSGTVTSLTSLPGGSGMIAAALNNSDQAVGNGLLYSNGTVQSFLGLLPPGSGWSNLNATGINNLGQIVGQGTYGGRQVAFEMTPDALDTPEPGTLAIWALSTALAAAKVAAGAANRRTARQS
jgi:uncharacterized membrane protein